MNVLFFALRRADLCLFRFGRKALLPHGLTPARFDLLYLLKTLKQAPNHTYIASALGVSKPVITRMMRALLELKLVSVFYFQRSKYVQLTDLGRARLREAIINVKKPVERDTFDHFGAAKLGLLNVLEKWEGSFRRWQIFLERRTWELYKYDHPDD